ncbi:MAG: hypothetical protein JWN67_3921 [Actinomycetia bacterium]|nr:hypothetical protein [Actinomycetes bacterium]
MTDIAFDPSAPPVQLADVWPRVESQLRASLRFRGAALATVDDIVQETAARAWKTRTTWASYPTLVAWCLTVAKRLLTDEHRHDRRWDRHAEPPDRPSYDDTATSALARLDLLATAQLLAGLSLRDQQLLVPGVGPSRALQANDYVRRHRARQELRRRLLEH